LVLSPVVAGLVPATPFMLALFLNVRDRRDQPGHGIKDGS
jgi:hypothetical protein